MIYRIYGHAKGATVFSVMTGVVSSVCLLAGVLLALFLVLWKYIPEKILDIIDFNFNKSWVWVDVLLIAIGIMSALASKYISKKIAEKIIARKIKRSVGFAYRYTLENPYLFRYAASLNKEFAYSYYLDRDNIVRKKERKTRKVPRER
ncbi:MAG: hypothetical protein IKS13_08965 [Ruminococcus sp.]|nr:hypothetical protein [Ruminococcus sp.]